MIFRLLTYIMHRYGVQQRKAEAYAEAQPPPPSPPNKNFGRNNPGPTPYPSSCSHCNDVCKKIEKLIESKGLEFKCPVCNKESSDVSHHHYHIVDRGVCSEMDHQHTLLLNASPRASPRSSARSSSIQGHVHGNRYGCNQCCGRCRKSMCECTCPHKMCGSSDCNSSCGRCEHCSHYCTC